MKVNRNSPIGLFDSGVGGTSIWKEMNLLLPHESTIFLADSKNAPYGEKGEQRIIELSIKNTEYLLSRGCKIIVVACNTATTNAIQYLREHYEVPIIGIEPAIKPAAIQTKTNVVGILATYGTLSSQLFHKTTQTWAKGKEVIHQVGYGLVELIENDQINTKKMEDLLRSYLEPMMDRNMDYLVLGCTHYPYLMPVLNKILPPSVTIIDSGEAVARQTQKVLTDLDLLANETIKPRHFFYTNRDRNKLKAFLSDVKVDFKLRKLNF